MEAMTSENQQQGHTLRAYQSKALDSIRAHYSRNERKVLLQMPTGSGKTTIFSEVLKSANEKGRFGVMAVRGRKLVDQASQRLIREGVRHGVLMSGHWLYRPHLPIQVCSIDTLIARNLVPKADIIVLDEVHMASTPSYKKFLNNYENPFILGVTATPYSGKSLRHVADHIVRPISMRELIEQGFLVGGRYFRPFRPDLEGVKVSKQTGDYDQKQLEGKMDNNALVGDVVEQWTRHGHGRPTIAFAVTIAHSMHIAERFNQAGIPAKHIEANTRERDREEAISDLRKGRLKVISNVGILCTGVDIPEASCGILARPTKSYCLYVQQVGRFTRPAPGKSDFIILDHADNVGRHGFVVDEPEAELDGKTPKVKSDVQICEDCFAAFRGNNCPACGKKSEPPAPLGGGKNYEHAGGELVELTGDLVEELQKEFEAQQRYADSMEEKRKAWGYKPAWLFFKLRDAYGEQTAKALMKGRWK